MIYEVRTYQVQPRKQPEFMKEFGAAYEHRKKHSPLAAFLYSEIGPLNQVIHIWPYKDAAERDRIRVEGSKDGTWPPKLSTPPAHMQSEIFVPAPFTPEMPTGAQGPIFEWRSYIVRPGSIGGIYDRWATALEERQKLSPLLMAMQTENGELNKFVHIWPYKDLNHRAEVRGEAAAKGIWPPKGGGDELITQENKIMLAAPFSPLQ